MDVIDVAVLEANGHEPFGGAGDHDPARAGRSGAVPPGPDGLRGDDTVADVELRWFVEGGPRCHARCSLSGARRQSDRSWAGLGRRDFRLRR